MSRNAWVIWGSASAGLVGAILWVVFADALTGGAEGGGWMSPALHNTAFQFWILVLLGGGISFAHQQFSQTKDARERARLEVRERKDEEKRVLLQTYDELLRAYQKTKRARRLLRARVLQAGSEDLSEHAHTVLASVYDTQMEALTDAQLDFEAIERRIEGNVGLFESQYGELRRGLDMIGEYLHDTLAEYEDQRTEFTGEPERRTLSDLPRLMEFVGPKGSGPEYSKEFERPFHEALRCLRLEVQKRSPIAPPEGAVAPPDPSVGASRGILGRTDGVVRLRPHHPEWAALFDSEASRLRETFREAFASIEHVGSTAVPNLLAEPVIDLLAEVETLDEGRRLLPELGELGYGYDPDPDAVREDRLFLCRWESDRCTHHLTLVAPGSEHAETAVRLRDLLRTDEGAREEFERTKRTLWREHRTDPAAYWEGVRDAGTALVRRGEVPRD